LGQGLGDADVQDVLWHGRTISEMMPPVASIIGRPDSER
jgi:hypothetical protein